MAFFQSCVALPPLPGQNSDGRGQKSIRLLFRCNHNHLWNISTFFNGLITSIMIVNVDFLQFYQKLKLFISQHLLASTLSLTSLFWYVFRAGRAKRRENIAKRRTWMISRMGKINLLTHFPLAILNKNGFQTPWMCTPHDGKYRPAAALQFIMN